MKQLRQIFRSRMGRLLVVVGAAILAFVAWWALESDEQEAGSQSPQSVIGKIKSAVSSLSGKEAKRREILGSLNNPEFSFYGKVVDQNGLPVEGALIESGSNYNTGWRSGTRRFETKSDPNGLFSFQGIRGKDFGLFATKEGYEYTHPIGYNGFVFSHLAPPSERYTPDPLNPYVVKMWKRAGAEPLLYFPEVPVLVPAEGAPVFLDLLTGATSKDTGDVSFSMPREVVQNFRSSADFRHVDWTFSMEVPGGGLIHLRDALMYRAPEDGYVPKWELSKKAKDEWYGIDRADYYVKTARGHYARVRIEAKIGAVQDNVSLVRVTWWINPAGSRNLEPGKETTPKRTRD